MPSVSMPRPEYQRAKEHAERTKTTEALARIRTEIRHALNPAMRPKDYPAYEMQ